jgi:hypothetical protein
VTRLFPPALSRRQFLYGSAATIASRPALSLAESFAPDVDTAAPRGRQRNLLAHACSSEKLKASLIPSDKYHPFPTIQDRAAWGALRPETRKALLEAGEKYLGFHWPEMPATVFLEYARDGNRTHYEGIRNARMGALEALLFAECVEGKGRFLDDIANGLWATCEESFWGVPAHLYIQKSDLGLPDPRDPIVDLFAAQTSALVATTVYLLNTRLDAVSPQLRERAIFEAERRILEPCLSQNFMWMGLPGGKTRHDLPWITVPKGQVQPVNNWDSWICWNWLTTILFLDRNPDRHLRGVQKVTVCLDKFINTYPDDGGCEEGPSYWNVASGAMFDALELLNSSTSGAINIYGNPLLTNMAMYLNRTHIAADYYINQGDAPPIVHIDVDKLFRFGKRLNNPDVIALATSNLRPDYIPSTLPAIFSETALRAEPRRTPPLFRDTWLPDSRIMAARIRANSTEGLYLACIAADNGKSHSHNDTGSFWLYSNGHPILIDLGQEAYRRQSFNEHRYEIPSTQSAFHNLPTIGSAQQFADPSARATDVVYRADDRSAELSMELATAYPAAANLKTWRRTVRLDRTANRVEIDDSYLLTRPTEGVFLGLMTACDVTIPSAGTLRLVSKQGAPPTTIQFDPSLLNATVDTITLDNERLVLHWGATVYRIRLQRQTAAISGKFRLTILSS